jgi:hypothetical protein
MLVLVPDIYYLSFPKDRTFPSKFLVYSLFLFEFAQSIVVTRDGFKYFGPGWGNMEVLNLVGWLWLAGGVMTGIGKSATNSVQRLHSTNEDSWWDSERYGTDILRVASVDFEPTPSSHPRIHHCCQ